MLRINRKLSVYISLALTVLMFLSAVVFAFFLPSFTEYLIGIPDYTGERYSLARYQRVLIHISAYCELALMILGLGMLFALLILVLKEKVFTAAAVELIRYISWCLIFMGVILIALTFFFTLALPVGIAVLFVGLAVRVVKNVIEAAVCIKEENDLTV